MGNYMSDEKPKIQWHILHSEIVQLGEEYEVVRGGAEWASVFYKRCKKNPGHTNMVAFSQFSLEAIPAPWRDPWMYNYLTCLSRLVVKITVEQISPDRPDNYPQSQYRGMSVPSCGSGFVNNVEEVLDKPPIDCPIEHCDRPRPHKVTPMFRVKTANHVVFDNFEAEKTTLTFFFDAADTKTVKGEVICILASNKKRDDIALQCVSHDLELFDKMIPTQLSPSLRLPRQQPRDPLVAIVSHPHGHFKHVSFGEWVGYGPDYVDANILNRFHSTGSINMNECMESVFDSKLSDILKLIESRHPTIRETASTIFGERMSPELFSEMEQAVQDNPNITMKDYRGQTNLMHVKIISYITYTAATCPGSSGAPVLVFFDKKDGTIGSTLWSTHYRHNTKKARANKLINVSGFVINENDYSEDIKHYKQSLTREK